MSKVHAPTQSATQLAVAILAKAYEDRRHKALVQKQLLPMNKLLDYNNWTQKFLACHKSTVYTDEDSVTLVTEVPLYMSGKYAVVLRLAFKQDEDGPSLTGNAEVQMYLDGLGDTSATVDVLETADEIEVDLTEDDALDTVLAHLLRFAVDGVSNLLDEILGNSVAADEQRAMAKKVVLESSHYKLVDRA